MMMQLFRSVVTIIVVGTMAAMIFSLRSELAESLRGAERKGWKWWDQKCSVSCHYYKKNEHLYVAYQNVTSEPQKADGHDLAPHGFLLLEGAK